MPANLACNALRYAIPARLLEGTNVYSDRRSYSPSRAFAMILRVHGMQGSMGRVALAADDAAMESFFPLLLDSALNCRRWATRDELRLAVVTWIKRDYLHRSRRRAAFD